MAPSVRRSGGNPLSHLSDSSNRDQPNSSQTPGVEGTAGLPPPPPPPSSGPSTTLAKPSKPATLSVLEQLHSTITAANTSSSSHHTGTGSNTQTGAQAIAEQHTTQIAHRQLLLRPSSPDPNSRNARDTRRKKRLSAAARARSQRRPKPLSAREKRVLGVYDLELRSSGSISLAGTCNSKRQRKKTQADWDVWLGLFGLWTGYVWKVFGLDVNVDADAASNAGGAGSGSYRTMTNLSSAFLGPKVTSLDLHGGLLRVVKAHCSSLVGVWGVCVRETKFSVVLVDDRCVVRRVGKRGVVFAVEVPLPGTSSVVSSSSTADGSGSNSVDLVKDLDIKAFLRGEAGEKLVLEISGAAIECRPVDRATKKFKGRKYDGF